MSQSAAACFKSKDLHLLFSVEPVIGIILPVCWVFFFPSVFVFDFLWAFWLHQLRGLYQSGRDLHPSLPNVSASSFPWILQWDDIQCTTLVKFVTCYIRLQVVLQVPTHQFCYNWYSICKQNSLAACNLLCHQGSTAVFSACLSFEAAREFSFAPVLYIHHCWTCKRMTIHRILLIYKVIFLSTIFFRSNHTCCALLLYCALDL